MYLKNTWNLCVYGGGMGGGLCVCGYAMYGNDAGLLLFTYIFTFSFCSSFPFYDYSHLNILTIANSFSL